MLCRLTKTLGAIAVMIGLASPESESLLIPIVMLIVGAGLLWISMGTEPKKGGTK